MESLKDNYFIEFSIDGVLEVEEDKIVVDANHPLAGKDLLFDIEVVEIK